jgi:hypothetical protein
LEVDVSAPADRPDTLAAAQAHPQGTLIMEGDTGGQIYVAALVRCPEHDLWQLLSDLDRIAWAPGSPLPELPEGARYPGDSGAGMSFQALAPGQRVGGGMGGGQRTTGIWVHDEFRQLGLAREIAEVIQGCRQRISLRDVPPDRRPSDT